MPVEVNGWTDTGAPRANTVLPPRRARIARASGSEASRPPIERPSGQRRGGEEEEETARDDAWIRAVLTEVAALRPRSQAVLDIRGERDGALREGREIEPLMFSE